MKYFVEVNARYLVSIEADSALSAEHVCLDLDGVQYAMAFDADARNTDTFRGVLLDVVTVSFEELKAMSAGYAKNWKRAAAAKDEAEAAAAEERRLHEELERAIECRKAAASGALNALNAAKKYQREVMGMKD